MNITPIPPALKDSFERSAGNSFNFGLWFNKYITRTDPFMNNNESKKEKVNYDSCVEQFIKIATDNAVRDLLEKKNSEIYSFCKSLESTHNIVEARAMLVSPLITGIGETHPGEVGMVFDHTIGIPYIPASGIKGIHRLFLTIAGISSLPEEKLNQNILKEEEIDEDLPATYGTNESRGKVIFLDVYPEEIPELHVEIMNPHYSTYYQSDKKDVKPPNDKDNPIPIKFLTVKPGTIFTFRVLVSKRMENAERIRDKVEKSINEILINGVGAKTSVGYGRFQLVSDEVLSDKIPGMSKENIDYELDSLHIVDIVNVSENEIRVRTIDGIESPIGKKKSISVSDKSLQELFNVGDKIHVKVIGKNKKGEPRFKVDR